MSVTRWMGRMAKWLVVTVLVLVLALLVLAWGRIALVETQVPESDFHQGRWVQAGDVALHIQEYGDPSNPPLLAVGGTAGWAQTWVSNVDAMVAAGYHVVAVDLPPFGFSTRLVDGDYSRPTQAKRLAALMDQLQLKRIILLGHSYGGGPAAELAMQSPERIQHLILVDAAIGLRPDGADAAPPSGLAMRALGIRWLRTTVISLFASHPVFAQQRLKAFVYRTDKVTPERTALYTAQFKVHGFSAALGDWAFQFASEHGQSQSEQPLSYKKLTMPVTLIWGAEDQITPMAQAHALKALMPQSSLVLLPGIGHIPLFEDIELFNQNLTEVLAK